VETLTGFINGIALFFAGIGIIWESFERFYSPPEIVKDKLLTVAVLGFIVNMGMRVKGVIPVSRHLCFRSRVDAWRSW
jgi:Co/Zn/Cd efflux system component